MIRHSTTLLESMIFSALYLRVAGLLSEPGLAKGDDSYGSGTTSALEKYREINSYGGIALKVPFGWCRKELE